MRMIAIIIIVLSHQDLLRYHHREVGKETAQYEFDLKLTDPANLLQLNLEGRLKQGRLNLLITGGGYEIISNYQFEGKFQRIGEIFGPFTNDSIRVKITTHQAIGEWKISLQELFRLHYLLIMVTSGGLMVLVALLFILLAQKFSRAPFRYWAIGGGIWCLGVSLKIVCALLANRPVLAGLGSPILGSLYIGLLTGVFEIGVTLLLALLFRSLAENSRRGLMIGIGAGTVEAALIGLGSIATATVAMTGNPSGDPAVSQVARMTILTPLPWLVGPIERILAIICHTSSRMLVLFAVRKRSHLYFWFGFLIMTGIDAIAGYYHLTGLLNQVSLWQIEALILPFALISLPIIRWLDKHWD